MKFYEVCRLRAEGVPLAYLTRHREFFGLDFYVDERVLIPRPETELLVELSLEKVKSTNGRVALCDVGTGSGCIGITLAKHLPEAWVTALDISRDALDVARKNAEQHGVGPRMDFLQSDLLESVNGQSFLGIVANLPYVGRSEMNEVSPEVLTHEPDVALFGGEKGTLLFEKLFAQVSEMKLPPIWLIGEIGFSQRRELSLSIQKFFPAALVTWHKDLAGLDRAFMIECTYV